MANSKSSNSAPNAFVRTARKIYNPLGFKRGYNFTLWFIFAGALFGFVLARLPRLSIDGVFRTNSAPGEWYWMRSGVRKVGITLHLATILPAGFLVVFQFIPIIRYKALIFHRINGYLLIILLLLSHVGALMIARHSFGGGVESQLLVGVLAIVTTVGAFLAYYNIKRLQIDQHRAWMLRTWFYAASIITLRLIQITSTGMFSLSCLLPGWEPFVRENRKTYLYYDGNSRAAMLTQNVILVIISSMDGYYRAMSCKEIDFMYNNKAKFETSFPQCFSANSSVDGWIAVKADFPNSKPGIAVSLGMTFGAAGWLAFFLHVVGLEIYLHLTPRENERLRVVSYQRQLEAGFSNPGSSGLTSDRLGDSDLWQPPTREGKNESMS